MNLTARLGYHEPGNLVLNHLLVNGVFDRLCERETDKRLLHEKIIIALSYLFNRLPIFDLKDAGAQRKERSANSKVNLLFIFTCSYSKQSILL
jgi:hypothetical protein